MAAPQLADLVLENSNAPGTGPIVLGGAPEGRQTFADAFPAGGEVYYYASDGQQTEWGVGTLTVGSPNTLARTTVLGNLFGTKTALNFTQNILVWCEIPAEKCLQKNSDGSFSVRAETDYTQDEAVSAKSADARFAKITDPLVRSIAGDLDYPAFFVGVNKYSGRPWTKYTDKNGNQQWASAALASELNDGLGAKPNLSGGNALDGTQTVNNGDIVVATGGHVIAADGGDGSRFQLYKRPNTADDCGRLSLFDGSSWHEIAFSPSGDIITGKGNVAFTSQLPFPDKTTQVQIFDVTLPNGVGATITFPYPTAFRQIVAVVPVSISGDDARSDAWPLDLIDKTNSNFTLHIGGRKANHSYQIMAYGIY